MCVCVCVCVCVCLSCVVCSCFYFNYCCHCCCCQYVFYFIPPFLLLLHLFVCGRVTMVGVALVGFFMVLYIYIYIFPYFNVILVVGFYLQLLLSSLGLMLLFSFYWTFIKWFKHHLIYLNCLYETLTWMFCFLL